MYLHRPANQINLSQTLSSKEWCFFFAPSFVLYSILLTVEPRKYRSVTVTLLLMSDGSQKRNFAHPHLSMRQQGQRQIQCPSEPQISCLPSHRSMSFFHQSLAVQAGVLTRPTRCLRRLDTGMLEPPPPPIMLLVRS